MLISSCIRLLFDMGEEKYYCKKCGAEILFVDTIKCIHDGLCTTCYLRKKGLLKGG